jgi:hypothetical protein
MGRIKRGGGDDGEPARSPLGWSIPAAWLNCTEPFSVSVPKGTARTQSARRFFARYPHDCKEL